MVILLQLLILIPNCRISQTNGQLRKQCDDRFWKIILKVDIVNLL